MNAYSLRAAFCALLLLPLSQMSCRAAEPAAAANKAATAPAAAVNKAAAASVAAAAEDSEDSIEIVFGKEPVERGLTFDRQGVRPTTINLGGKESEAWMADGSIEPSMGWVRSFRFKVTDPRFQNGNRPTVDVELTFHQPANAGWSFKADTKTGGKQVTGGWGGTTGWRTEKFRIDDAYFGARDSKSGEKLSVDGFDLRFDGTNDQVYLQSIKIIGYDPRTNVNWARMVKTNAIETDAPGNIFVFNRAARHEIRVPVQNMAQVARPLFYQFDVSDYNDKNRHSSSGDAKLAPGSTQNVSLAFDSSKWPLGPYDAKLSLFLKKGDKTPIYSRSLRMGVVSSAALPKARPGEFLFGLDPANTYIYDTQDAKALAFYRVMGVDILRSLNLWGHEQNPENVGKWLQLLAKEKLQAMLMEDAPKDPDANRRNAALPGTVSRLTELARLYAGRGPGKIRYWEMGNEPDLTGFYPGSMTEYARAFEAMRAGIKAGAAQSGVKPQDTVVMNGGLSFAGPDGERRSREYLQVVDSAQVDAIAYHGHGKGGEAEREALERARDAAQKGGKNGARFIETESGFSGNDRNGLMEQARTVTEKLTYAQSQGLETFMFFRLFMEGSGSEGGYGLTDNGHEPRPSIMAYRNIVERLRHHVFVKSVDFAKAMDAPGLNAYLFEERDDQGAPTGRKTLVAWSEQPAQFDLSLRLDAAKNKVTSAQNFDLFGNASPTQTMAGNVASVPVGVEPMFVSWQSSGMSTQVDVAPSLLTVRAPDALLAGATTNLSVLARNPEAREQAAEIRVETFARLPVKASVSPAKITLRADGEPVTSQISVVADKTDMPLALPTWWKVFVDVDISKIADAARASVPETVSGKTGGYASSQSFAGFQRLDLAKIAGGYGEKRAALAVAIIDAPRDLVLPVAASADWWMQWSVNGKEVYSTLDRGNEHGGLADHIFDLPLKKGRNIISALTLSGSGGWRLEFGGPKERALALSSGTDPDRAVVSLVANGKVLSKQVVPLEVSAPVPGFGAAVPTSLSDWMTLQPLAVTGAESITNFFVKEPDQSRWYKGEDDLSALIWAREDGANLRLFVAARDDTSVEAPNAAGLQKADSIRVFIRDESGKTLMDSVAGLVNGKTAATGTASVQAVVTREGQRTLYALTIPRSLLGTAPFRLSLALSDNDSNYLKQKLSLADANGLRLILP